MVLPLMVPVTWPEFGSIHPCAPLNQAEGYHQLIQELHDWLATFAFTQSPNGNFAFSFRVNLLHATDSDAVAVHEVEHAGRHSGVA